MDAKQTLKGDAMLPIREIAGIDYSRGGDLLANDSQMLSSLMLHTGEERNEFVLEQYREACSELRTQKGLPKIAILQLREGEPFDKKAFLSLKEAGNVDCSDYELIYVRNGEIDNSNYDEVIRASHNLYSEFNSDDLRPRNYYGHSLSVSDILVYSDEARIRAFYVDRMGFAELPDEFLNKSMVAKIQSNIDVRCEAELYASLSKFELDNNVSVQDGEAINRQFMLNSYYSHVFDMADRRGAIMDMEQLGYSYSYVREENTFIWKSKKYSEVVLPISEIEDIKEFVIRQTDSEYRRQVQTVWEWEVANGIPEHQRITTWAHGQNVSSAQGASHKDIYDKYSLIVSAEAKRLDDVALSSSDYRDDLEAINLVAAYEEFADIPEQNRYTSWFGDYNMHEIKHDVEQSAFSDRLSDALTSLGFSNYDEYLKSEYLKNSNSNIVGAMIKKKEVLTDSSEKNNFSLKQEQERKVPMENIDESLSPKEQLQQRLENGIRGVLDSEQFKNWLNTGSKMFYKNYSFQNAMLIYLQKPQATYTMSYEKWKDFGRNVTLGAQGAKVFVPLMASEKTKGGLFSQIKRNLKEQLDGNADLAEASYHLGKSNIEFTMNRSGLIGFKVNGIEKQIFASDEDAKRFIDRAIVGKVPIGFTVGTVFDVSDTAVPEYLWVKRGYTKSELALDENGKPIKNNRGEVKIINTPERQARFQTQLDMSVSSKTPDKMGILFEACVAASQRKGVLATLSDKDNDKVLKEGASGYFSRERSAESPNGKIVIDNGLSITEKCSVLLHEMGHADLHGNLDKLAVQMGEKSIPREMREVQAEAVAFAVASNFGIETDTSSFKYLAVYSRGFELQDFKKSLEVIYKEAKELTDDIRAELDIRGYNLDLTEKDKSQLTSETLSTLSAKYLNFASERNEHISSVLGTLTDRVKESAENAELMDILREQGKNLENQKTDVELVFANVDELNRAETREEQDKLVEKLDCAMCRLRNASNDYDALAEKYESCLSKSNVICSEFRQNPKKALGMLGEKFPELTKLSSAQMSYLENSKYLQRELAPVLRNSPKAFVEQAIERANMLHKVASKNGTFVEVSFCEQWTDKPFFVKGTLCSPKIADKIVAESELQTRGFKAEAELRGEYFPYSKCDLTVFTPKKNGSLSALEVRVDIGDGSQDSLKDHLEQVCSRASEKEVLRNFTEALSERADKRKIFLQGDKKETVGTNIDVKGERHDKTEAEWTSQIDDAKQAAKGKTANTGNKDKAKTAKNKE